MDWGEFWTAISAIGTCAAVIIALWQSGYKTQKRMNAVLKLQEDKIIDSYNGMIKTGHVIKSSAIIDITNIFVMSIIAEDLITCPVLIIPLYESIILSSCNFNTAFILF